LALEADYLATGHYARIIKADREYKLLKGIDPAKDQSYVLYMLKVRSLAREFSLPIAEREESQEICFIPGNDYRHFLRLYASEAIRPGPIYDAKGHLLGTHKRLPF